MLPRRGGDASAPARAALRRQRLDGALLAHAAALRPCARRAGIGASRRSVFDAADAHHERTARRRLDDAVAAVVAAVPDWSGGTRIGEALRQFHQRWSRRVLHGGAGRAAHLRRLGSRRSAVLRDQIARLQRSCHRLIWLNPLIGTADYAPLTRGLQAALPFVDDFLPARTLTNLADSRYT